MKNIVELVNSLPNMLPLKPATVAQIEDAEKQINLKFAEEYKEYLLNFGAILADGIELSGIAKSEYRNVVMVTKREWNLNSKVPHHMYVIENARVDGIIIWQDEKGVIYRTTYDTEPIRISKSLFEYISTRK